MQIEQVSPENTSLILKSVDAVISPLSTILIDAAALGTPLPLIIMMMAKKMLSLNTIKNWFL